MTCMGVLGKELLRYQYAYRSRSCLLYEYRMRAGLADEIKSGAGATWRPNHLSGVNHARWSAIQAPHRSCEPEIHPVEQSSARPRACKVVLKEPLACDE